MSDGDPELVEFVRQAERTLDGGDLSAGNTDLRIVLPLLKTLGWNVHGPEVVADHPVTLDGDPGPRAGDGRENPEDGTANDEDGETGPGTAPGDGPGPDEVVIDYALTLDGRPAVLVVTDATDTPLSSEHGRRLGAAMEAAGVERGVATNGRSFVFVDAEDGTLREESCGLADLPERASLLALYTKRAARERMTRRREADRQAAAERLRERRESTVAAVEDALVGDVDGPIADELATAAEGLVDDAIDALDAGEHPTTATGAETADTAGDPAADDTAPDHETPHPTNGEGATATDGPATAEETAATAGEAEARTAATETASAGATGTDGTTTGATGGEGSAGTPETDPRDEAAPMARNTGADEYVVRFFDERSSVGAVGSETSGGCVAQTVGYLIQQHSLDNRLDLPWAPDEGETIPASLAVVNREPVHRDGTEMRDPTRLANGYHVETALEPAPAREVVEALAEQTGLRVMFQGRW